MKKPGFFKLLGLGDGKAMAPMETERLILRRFSCDDWKDMHEYLSSEKVVRYEPYGPLNRDDCKVEAAARSKNDSFWAVCLKGSPKLIGNMYFEQVNPKEYDTWEIGYVFNQDYWGKGYATEAAFRMLEYGFNEKKAHRIIGRCNMENASSWKLLERLGMRREGSHLKSGFFKRSASGEPLWHNAYQYAILREEWINKPE